MTNSIEIPADKTRLHEKPESLQYYNSRFNRVNCNGLQYATSIQMTQSL